MVPISYQVVGEEDYALKIAIDDGGGYVIESGDYTSHPPRKGRLSVEQEQQLVDAIMAPGCPRAPDAEGATAFEAQLTVGAKGTGGITCSGRAHSKRTSSSTF